MRLILMKMMNLKMKRISKMKKIITGMQLMKDYILHSLIPTIPRAISLKKTKAMIT